MGKTSLFNQFIYNKFSDKYLTTIGVKVNKKTIMIDDRELSLLIWDIAGEVSQDKVPTSYFLGASGIIYVFDLTRPSTYKKIKEDLDYLQGITKDAVIKIVGNKKDLVDEAKIQEVEDSIAVPWDIITSAKTGENVDDLFFNMGKALLD